MSDINSYNPLAKENLGRSVADALLELPCQPLKSEKRFVGAGIYAIYYTGDFKPYEKIRRRNQNDNFEQPIYVGKAVPPGSRKGNFGLDGDPGPALFKRLNEHAESINQAKNLKLSDFFRRALVVDDIWIPLGESLLIARYSPIWNKLNDGFGNHTPGKGRYQQLRSRVQTHSNPVTD
jgi:hypothetical protein